VRDGVVDAARFDEMRDTLAHRGPDGAGSVFRRGGRVALGHRRLSIIDLSENANQPMSNEDGTVWLTYNGEIYNFVELRRELVKHGHVFRSRSDSEVIIHAYEQWDRNCVSRLRGIFAFGIWDERHDRLFLARDQLGVKPLYYWEDASTFIFASQPRAILAAEGIAPSMDWAAMGDYLAYGYVPFDRAIFKGMHKLPAAHRLVRDGSGTRVERYWRPTYRPEIRREKDAVSETERMLEESVALQKVSDVPVGTFLSGGIDSAGVTGILSEVLGQPLTTFTIGFEDENSDEREFAKLAAQHLGVEQRVDVLTRGAFEELLPSFCRNHDEPFLDSSGVPCYFVSQLARKNGYKVVQTGDGGDEIFAGYLWYDRFYRRMHRPWWRRMGSRMKRRIAPPRPGTLVHPASVFFSQVGFLTGEDQAALLTTEARQASLQDHTWLLQKFYRSDCPPVTAAQLMDLQTYLPDDILTKVDRASMACGLEARVPFLDLDLVELAFRIDARLQYGPGGRKHVLKKALSRWVPDPILTARKKGFSVPLDRWMGQCLRGYADRLLKDGCLVQHGVCSGDAVGEFVREAHSKNVWLVLVLELWARRWLGGESPEVSWKLIHAA